MVWLLCGGMNGMSHEGTKNDISHEESSTAGSRQRQLPVCCKQKNRMPAHPASNVTRADPFFCRSSCLRAKKSVARSRHTVIRNAELVGGGSGQLHCAVLELRD